MWHDGYQDLLFRARRVVTVSVIKDMSEGISMTLPTSIKEILASCREGLPCTDCDGLSQWETKALCDECRGGGKAIDKKESCEQCQGRGFMRTAEGDRYECEQCGGFGCAFEKCESCDGLGFVWSEHQCAICDADGRVSFAEVVRATGDDYYLLRLLAHAIHFLEAGSQDDLPEADALLRVLEELRAGEAGRDLVFKGNRYPVSGIDAGVLVTLRERLDVLQLERERQRLGVAQKERTDARLEAIRDQAERYSEASEIREALNEKYGST
jgi:RecJ-like exonuclease